MSSLIRDVLMPAAPALALIAALLTGSPARAEEGPIDGPVAIAGTDVLVARATEGEGSMPAESGRRADVREDDAAELPTTPRCKRVNRIGKFTIRRCR
jgi:hypothetical protein